MPTPIFHLDYVNGQQRTKIYTYDGDASELLPTPNAGFGTGEVVYTGEGIEFYVDGSLAMVVSDDGIVEVNEITYLVNPGADVPRVEFMRAVNSVPQRLAYIDGDGKLSVPQIQEGEEPPETTDRMVLAGAVLMPNLMYAAEFRENV